MYILDFAKKRKNRTRANRLKLVDSWAIQDFLHEQMAKEYIERILKGEKKWPVVLTGEVSVTTINF